MILSNGSVGRFDENDVWIEIEEGLTEVQMEEFEEGVCMKAWNRLCKIYENEDNK